MKNVKAYSAAAADSPLASDTIARRAVTESDVEIDLRRASDGALPAGAVVSEIAAGSSK